MWKVILYIYQTAYREFRLVGALKIAGLALLPTIWTGIATYFEWGNSTPSKFTWFLLTGLCLSLGFLYVIAKRAQSIEEPKFVIAFDENQDAFTQMDSLRGGVGLQKLYRIRIYNISNSDIGSVEVKLNKLKPSLLRGGSRHLRITHDNPHRDRWGRVVPPAEFRKTFDLKPGGKQFIDVVSIPEEIMDSQMMTVHEIVEHCMHPIPWEDHELEILVMGKGVCEIKMHFEIVKNEYDRFIFKKKEVLNNVTR